MKQRLLVAVEVIECHESLPPARRNLI